MTLDTGYSSVVIKHRINSQEIDTSTSDRMIHSRATLFNQQIKITVAMDMTHVDITQNHTKDESVSIPSTCYATKKIFPPITR